MRLQYLHELACTASVEESVWDVMIVGAGPVGLSLAAELTGGSGKLLVVESGDVTGSWNTTDLDRFENIGAPRLAAPHRLRARGLGGTSLIWSGRCTPFDPIDLEERSWVPFSGWPLSVKRTLPSNIHRASVHLGLSHYPHDQDLWRDLRSPAVAYDATQLRSQFWQYSRDQVQRFEYTRFGPRFMKRNDANIDILLGATVTRLNFSPAGTSLTSVEVATPDDQRQILRAKRVVLCAGGIENSRLLLIARRSRQVCGSSLPATGRFLMDHPRCTIGTFAPTDVALATRFFGINRLRTPASSHLFTRGVALGAATQRDHRLLNCAAWLTEVRADDDPWEALKRLSRGGRPRRRDLVSIVSNVPSIARGSWRYGIQRRGVTHKCDALHLDCLVEQVPDPESRVTLSDASDRHGLPLSRIHWKVGTLEKATVSRFGTIIAAELRRLGGPALRLSGWIRDGDDARADMIDVAHPMGTTRMSADPRLGVVDENGRVHGIDNLYVAGSSVFPTAGHANPTLMAIALTVRLADHIKVTA